MARHALPTTLPPPTSSEGNALLHNYATIAKGTCKATRTPMSTALLCAVLDRAKTTLKAVMDAARTGTRGQWADQTTLEGPTALTSPAFNDLVCAQTCWATVHALDECAAR